MLTDTMDCAEIAGFGGMAQRVISLSAGEVRQIRQLLANLEAQFILLEKEKIHPNDKFINRYVKLVNEEEQVIHWLLQGSSEMHNITTKILYFCQTGLAKAASLAVGTLAFAQTVKGDDMLDITHPASPLNPVNPANPLYRYIMHHTNSFANNAIQLESPLASSINHTSVNQTPVNLSFALTAFGLVAAYLISFVVWDKWRSLTTKQQRAIKRKFKRWFKVFTFH